MSIEKNLERLEERAVSVMRNINPNTGTIHDYRNVMNHVDRAMRALNAAYIAIHKAEDKLSEMQESQ